MKSTLCLLVISATMALGCSQKKSTSLMKDPKQNLVIAFGSCSHQDREQKLWPDVINEKPDLWIWLGDNIYGDSEDMSVLREKYNKQKSDSAYQILMKTCPIIGTWDDHDFGLNDGGKNYGMKEKSQQVFLDFLDVPAEDKRRTQAGVYTSHLIEKAGIKVRVFLLDTRYFRDDLKKENNINVPDSSGQILGEEQWTWLENEMAKSKADVNIIASGIQVIPNDHIYEKWGNFPIERTRLLNLISSSGIKTPIIISGDRHMGEISKLDWQNQTIYDITSSSLTHGWSEKREEKNVCRVNDIVYDENYGIIEIGPNFTLASIKSQGQEVKSATYIQKPE